ncbi:D-arabinono-1,4-lactone oxidase [Mariniluteicoccus endophyticus]
MSKNLWSNWSGNVTCDPLEVAYPSSTQEVAALVRRAAERGLTVKAVGAGHSFSAIAEASGVQVSLDRMAGLVSVDAATKQVTLRAGTRLHNMPGILEPLGLAMENLGDIDAQSLAGAVSTSTHGTGLGFGGIATQVVGLEIVDGRGEVHRLSGQQVRPVVVSLGALGIVTEVTLQCVDRFVLEAVEAPEPLADVREPFVERVAAADHFEFYWFPHTKTALTKTQTRHPATRERAPLGRVKRFVDDDLVANRLFDLTCRLGSRVPAVVPTINRVAERLTGDRAHTDWSTNVYTTRRDVRFREMEFSIPLEAMPEALKEIDALIESRRWKVSFPLECRGVAGDDLWMSTAYGRDSGYIAVHRYVRDDERAYFQACQEILYAHDGRPHWGKMHSLTRADLEPRYERFADFSALRDEMDPQRVFANPYLDRVLGR